MVWCSEPEPAAAHFLWQTRRLSDKLRLFVASSATLGSGRSVVWSFAILVATAACGGTLDAGYDVPRGLLPVDSRNPIVLCNDGPYDNWQGEYAMLFASTGGPSLAGIVVSDSLPWPNLDDNMAGWRRMVEAARESGLRNIPDPVASTGPVLVRPSDGSIDSTTPNYSEGAHIILKISKQSSLPFRPLVAVAGGRMTDLADAYLLDHTVPERIVVVAALGSATAGGGEMGSPNGDLDPWADFIVAQKFRYIQVSAFYEQAKDFPDSVLEQLPANAFASWIQAKQPNVWQVSIASDQVGVLAVAVPSFVSAVSRAAGQGVNSEDIPILSSDPTGTVWLVTEIDRASGATRLWDVLLATETYDVQ